MKVCRHCSSQYHLTYSTPIIVFTSLQVNQAVCHRKSTWIDALYCIEHRHRWIIHPFPFTNRCTPTDSPTPPEETFLFYPVWASGSEGCLNDVSLAVVSTLYLNISIEFISHLTLFTEVLGQRAIIHVCQSCWLWVSLSNNLLYLITSELTHSILLLWCLDMSSTLDKCCNTFFGWNYDMYVLSIEVNASVSRGSVFEANNSPPLSHSCMGLLDDSCARALWYPGECCSCRITLQF